MRDINQIGQRNMTKLRFKMKIVVFYGSKEDKDVLDKLKSECNTSTCQYTIVPIHIEVVGRTVTEAIIKKNIQTHVSGYKNDIDRVCITEPCILQSSQYILFDSVNKFKTWFEVMQNEIG